MSAERFRPESISRPACRHTTHDGAPDLPSVRSRSAGRTSAGTRAATSPPGSSPLAHRSTGGTSSTDRSTTEATSRGGLAGRECDHLRTVGADRRDDPVGVHAATGPRVQGHRVRDHVPGLRCGRAPGDLGEGLGRPGGARREAHRAAARGSARAGGPRTDLGDRRDPMDYRGDRGGRVRLRPRRGEGRGDRSSAIALLVWFWTAFDS
jgi:hypothetical protein